MVKSNVLLALFVGLFAIGCSRNEESVIVQNEPLNKETKVVQKELKESLKHRYGIDVTLNEKGNYVFNYSDGKKIEIIEDDGFYSVQGDKIPNKILEIKVDEIPLGKEYEMVSFSIKDENVVLDNPCDQHSKNESFSDCFAREWKDFCDGVIGCTAQITHPKEVAIAIAIHCATC